MSHHVVSWKVYLGVFLALVALTVITVWVAGHDFGEFNLVVALGVAITKATLVVLYFMHVKYASRLTKIFVCAAFLWLAILFALTFADYVTRGWLPNSRGWTDQAGGTPQVPAPPVGSAAH